MVSQSHQPRSYYKIEGVSKHLGGPHSLLSGFVFIHDLCCTSSYILEPEWMKNIIAHFWKMHEFFFNLSPPLF